MDRSRLAIVVLVFGTLLFGAAIAARGSANPWWTNAAAAALVAVGSVAVLRGQAELFRLRLDRLGIALALALAMVAATHIFFALATRLIPGLEEVVAQLYREIDAQSPGKLITVVLICFVVVAEELLWRGVAMQLCPSHWNRLKIGVVVVLLYAVPQLIGGNLVLVAAAVAAGGVFTAQRLLGGDLVGPVVTHAIWSSCVFSLLPLT